MKTNRGISVCIPSIAPRREYLMRATASVLNQELAVEEICVAMDPLHEGAWSTRNRALAMAGGEWVVFLDDDDELCPWYTRTLYTHAVDTDSDMVWGWFQVIGGQDPFPHYRGKQYDIEQPHIVPITYLVKRELIQAAMEAMGGFQVDGDAGGSWDVQDMPVINWMVQAGAKLSAIEQTVWHWHHHGRNTSGIPTRW